MSGDTSVYKLMPIYTDLSQGPYYAQQTVPGMPDGNGWARNMPTTKDPIGSVSAMAPTQIGLLPYLATPGSVTIAQRYTNQGLNSI